MKTIPYIWSHRTKTIGFVSVILGVLAGNGVAIELVRPAVWKKAARISKDKGSARKAAQERFPDSAGLFARAKDDGRAEAALLARWRAEGGQCKA